VTRLIGPRSPIWKQEKAKLEKQLSKLETRLESDSLDREEKLAVEMQIRDLERAVKPSWEKERDRLEEKLGAAQARTKEESLPDSQKDRAKKEVEQLKRSLETFIPRDEHLSMPIEVRPQLGGNCAIVKIDEEEHLTTVGTWSDWYRVKFDVTPLISVHGICKVLLKSVTPYISVYVSPIEISPEKPPVSICHPGSYCKELVQEIGLFKTRGWAADSAALKEGFIDERAFMNDVFEIMDKRLEITLKTLEKDDWGLFVSVFSSTDRVSHMMWRLIDPAHPMYDEKLAEEYGDSIEKVYIKMDEMVGKIRERIDEENTDFYVISDHGFRSFRNGVNLNSWLSTYGPGGAVDKPFMKLRGKATRKYNLTELFGGNTDFFQMQVYDPILETTRSEDYVDWSQTKAFALGLATVYINLEGRESRGVVKRSEYDAVCDEIIRGLENLTDPETGDRVVRKVYRGSDIFHGPYADMNSVTFPDLVVGFEEGYRVGWQSTLGGISEKVVSPNAEKWSGDHCGIDPSLTTGIFFSNRKFSSDRPRMIDLAPTILASLEVEHPEMQGIDLHPGGAESN
jgi:predicted AlkP superfamily phosphohydrolase/phosphomutase